MGVKRWVVEISKANRRSRTRIADRAQLEAWLRMQRIARALATRARIVRRSAAGESICALVEGSRSLSARPVCGGDAMRAMAWTVCRTGRALRVLDGSASAKEQAVVSATLRKS